jgi:hypothetical protein
VQRRILGVVGLGSGVLELVELDRPSRWPDESHFRRSADLQAGLIGSERFREFSQAVLAATAGGSRSRRA